MNSPFRIAAVVTTFFPNSHAGVLVTKFLQGFPTDDGLIAPRVEVASLYIDQIHSRDIGLQLAHEHRVPVFESIRGALTLGGSELAVDAVLLIGEHGDYPVSTLGQEMLPRRYFFEQICGVIAESGSAIPVFSDKHFSYTWEDAHWMYRRARELDIPFWAGSSLPVTWRRPQWEHPEGESIDEALAIGFHMLERYGFHGLECLQCQVERRTGGETGVSTVQCLSGESVWNAMREERWSRELADAALAGIEGGPGRLDPAKVDNAHLILLEYGDGLPASVLMLGDSGYVRKFAYAERSGTELSALEYHIDTGPCHATFSYLGLNVEDFFLTGVPPSPVERTYLTTGILEAVMRSHAAGGTVIDTPHLDIGYLSSGAPRRPANERPAGACLEPWPLPEPGDSPAADRIPANRDGTVRTASAEKTK